MFRFFLDENVPRQIAERLRSEGHDVVEVVTHNQREFSRVLGLETVDWIHLSAKPKPRTKK